MRSKCATKKFGVEYSEVPRLTKLPLFLNLLLERFQVDVLQSHREPRWLDTYRLELRQEVWLCPLHGSILRMRCDIDCLLSNQFLGQPRERLVPQRLRQAVDEQPSEKGGRCT